MDDKRILPVPIVLSCDSVQYNQPFNEYSNADSGGADMVFVKLVKSLSMKSFSDCVSLSVIPHDIQETDRAKISEQIIKLASNYSPFFDGSRTGWDIDHLQVFQKFFIGNDAVIVWGINSDSSKPSNGPTRRWFKFVQDNNGSYSWDYKSYTDSISLLITSIMEGVASDPFQFVQSCEQQSKYMISIPGVDSEHKVYIKLNGQMCNFDILNDAVDPKDEVLSLMQLRQRLLLLKHYDAVSELYTESCAQKFREWIAKLGPDKTDEYFSVKRTQKVVIRFVIDANPLYIVYSQNLQDQSAEFVAPQCLVRDKDSGVLKFTHYYYGGIISCGPIEKVLFNKEFFTSIISNTANK